MLLNLFLSFLGMNRRPVVDKNVRIPSATIKLYRAMLEENTMTTHFPLPGLHTSSANTVRTYPDQGNTNMLITNAISREYWYAIIYY